MMQPTALNLVASDLTASDLNNASKKHAPIGLFDSGVGGLSVYLHLYRLMPNEQYIYYADTLNVPYGSRSSQQIKQFTLTAVQWLYEQGCKLVVIACNSASAHALEEARKRYPDLPIVGLVPALKPAVLASKTKHVAVLATKATLDGALLNQVISEVALPHQTQVTKCFDPQLVPWVEAGMPLNDPVAKRLLQRLHDYEEQKVDHLVLGCTHYPFFRPLLESYINKQNLSITVVDSGAAIASRVANLLPSAKPLINNELQNSYVDCEQITRKKEPKKLPCVHFYATAYQPKLAVLAQTLIQQPITVLNEQ